MKHLRKAVVTGGNGCIGSVLVQSLLSEGVEVHAIAHRNRDQLDSLLPPQQVHLAEDTDSSIATLIEKLQPDAIFHLAAHNAEVDSFDKVMAMVDANIRMGTALLYGATNCKDRPVFVNAGSYWQFADGDEYCPNTFYAATKQSFHDLMLYFSRSHGVRAMTLILYDSFAPQDTRSKLWTKLLRAPAGSRFPLTEGIQYVELLHVDDIARAFIHAARMLMQGEGAGRSFAVRSEEPVTLRAMLEDWQRQGVLDLEFDWGVIPYSSGQIFKPWRGKVLPGWSRQIDVHTAIADWLRQEHTNKTGGG